MQISELKTILEHHRMERPVREFLEKNQLSRLELLDALERYLRDPVSFVLCEDSNQGKVRNNIITLYQLLKDTLIPKAFEGVRVVFYSCGTVFAQNESVGHFDIEVDGSIYRVDPGVGACASALKQLKETKGKAAYDPLWLDGIFLTHSHPDHAGDFHTMFERMRWCGQIDASHKHVIGNQTAMLGAPDFDCGPVLDKYKKSCLQTHVMTPGDTRELNNLKIEAVAAHHVEAVDGARTLANTCLGYRIDTRHGSVGITGDSEWHEGLAEAFAGVDILIAYITQEAERAGTATQKDYGLTVPAQFHRQFLGEKGAVELIKQTQPKFMTVLTDFGDQLKSPNGQFDVIPERLTERVRAATNLSPVIPAAAGLVLELRDQNLNYYYQQEER